MHPERIRQAQIAMSVCAGDCIELLGTLTKMRARIASHFDDGDTAATVFSDAAAIPGPAEYGEAWQALCNVWALLDAKAPKLARICEP